jgi:hypothetical protein
MDGKDIVVDTDDVELGETTVNVAPADGSAVVVDTAEDGFDNIINQAAPPPSAAPRPRPSQPREEVKKAMEEPAPLPKPKPKKRHHPRAPADPESVEGYLDQNPRFAEALKRTIPEPEPNVFSSSDTESASKASSEEDATPPAPARGRSRHREDDIEEREEDEADEKAGSDDSSSASSSADGGSPKPDAPEGDEDDYIERMKLIEEIKGYAKMGAVPPQHPSFDMPVSLLRKIRDYQMTVVDEIMGVGFIGMGWVQIIGLVEKLNERYDPFARAFGMGLKLTGAKGAIEQNIHLYEAVFKHIYRKLNLGNNRELSPWVQLVTVTIQILSQVHMKNLEEEMLRQAREAAADPRTAEQAEHLRRMHEQRRHQQPPPQQPQPSDQPTMASVDAAVADVKKTEKEDAEPVVAEEHDEPAVPKPSTPVQLKQPAPPESEPVDEDLVGSHRDDEEEDDDVVVEIPRAKGRGKKNL